jgi:hypothetical protein
MYVMMKRRTKTLPKAEREAYATWCKKYGIDPVTNKLKVKPVGSVNKIPLLNPNIAARIKEQKQYKSIDSGITGAVYSKSMMDPLQWRGESKDVVDSIKAKSKRVSSLFNKGGIQYITDGTNLHDIGRKK